MEEDTENPSTAFTSKRRTCTKCGSANPPEAFFCMSCGRSLMQHRTSGSYTPLHLAQKILNSRSALEGERKQVTVLFCDIAGSTPLAELLGADAMHALVNRFFDLALDEIHRYEGTINQFLGDGFMALFGAPLAHEDHAKRAALASISLNQALREESIKRTFPDGFAVRMGLHAGLVVVGKIGDDLRMDYTAIGDTANLAARLQQIAEPGCIFASEVVHRLVEQYVECEQVGPRKIKGKTDLVTVFRVVRPHAFSRSTRSAQQAINSPLVGRETQLAILVACVDRLIHGQGGIVAVLGEAGLGKSRLMAEASSRAPSGGVLWLEGRALSFGRKLSYWPMLEILRRIAGVSPDDDASESRRKLERRLAGLFPEGIEDVLPYLATLLGLPVEGELERRVRFLDGEAIGRQVFRSVWRLLERLAAQQPVAIVFEDLHWTDHSTADLIEHLLPLTRKAPLLLCGIGRPEGSSPAGRLREVAARNYAPLFTEIALSALPPSSAATLVDNLLAGPQVPVRLKELILDRSEGNPFYVEEIIRALVGAGTLSWDERLGTWRTTREAERITVPDTLLGVITARVDLLDEEVKHVLKLASVIGRSFFYRILAGLGDASERLDVHLGELQHLELIREKRRFPELEYFFKHALVQEATYATILADRRRRLHHMVGKCIERLFADRVDEFHGLLAYHFASAEDWEKAQEYLFKAGDHAGRVAGDAEALAHYQEASIAYERAFGNRWDPVQQAILDRKLGEALFRRGEHKQAMEFLMRARARLDAPLGTSRAEIWLGIAKQLLRQLCHRLLPNLFLRRGLGRKEPVVVNELSRITELIGWIAYFTNTDLFLLNALHGLNYFERNHHTVGLVIQYMAFGLICDVVPAFSLAEKYHRRAVSLADETGHPIAIGHARLGLGMHEHSLGRMERALEYYQMAASIFREVGHIRGWGAAMTMRAWVFENRGEFSRALEHAEPVIAVARESSERQIEVWALQARARLTAGTAGGISKERMERLDETVDDLNAAIELAKRIPDYSSLAQNTALLGLCHLQRGHTGAALRLMEEANRIRVDRRLRGILVIWTLVGLAEATLAAADEADPGAHKRKLKAARHACQEAVRHASMVRPWLPTALRLRGALEWREGKRASAERSWRSSIAVAESLGSHYDVARTCLELARYTGNSKDLAKAASLFEELGVHDAVLETRSIRLG